MQITPNNRSTKINFLKELSLSENNNTEPTENENDNDNESNFIQDQEMLEFE